MRYLKNLLYTKNVELQIIDIALVVVLIPVLFIAKLPMLIYMFLVVFVLFIQKTSGNTTLVLVFTGGVSALFLSLYGEFNFAGLSRLKLFVELLLYVLIIAISLQRFTRKINIYLIISPVLILALSLFFFSSLSTLFYVVFEIFILLWMILAYRMSLDYTNSLRISGVIFILSIPFVVVLFIFFPRISFEHASFGFKGDSQALMGHDGTMFLDSTALLVPSSKIVMEVSFKDKIPSASKLYFRGSVLYDDHKTQWLPMPPNRVQADQMQHNLATKELIVYKVSLYPTHKQWLYLLDLPFEAPKGATIDENFEVKLKENITDPQRYEATSALTPSYKAHNSSRVLHHASRYDKKSNQRSLMLAQKIMHRYPNKHLRLDAIKALFKDANLTYTLKPEALDLNSSTDSFLFDKKRGYCVHFASSFATFARLSGIASRIVTGYKSSGLDSVQNYLVIREKDAHAWVEVLIDDRWVRIETTAFASHIDSTTTSTNMSGDKDLNIFNRLNLTLMYIKYQIESWILKYNYLRQMKLFEKLKEDIGFALKMVAFLILLVLLASISLYYLQNLKSGNKIDRLLQRLLKKLAQDGYHKKRGETLHKFLTQTALTHPKKSQLLQIDREYESFAYADSSTFEKLRHTIEEFL